MKTAAAVCLFFFCIPAQADPVEIEDPYVVEYLRAVHGALGEVSRAITACVKEGGNRTSCLCRHEALVLEFHAAVRQLLNAHPDVAGYSTVNWKESNGRTIAQNIEAMVRHMENPPDC